MRLQEIEKRMSEIALEIEKEGADLNALEIEITNLKEERKAIQDTIEKRKSLLSGIANMQDATVIKTFDDEKKSEERKMEYGLGSKEYRSAFLKNLIGGEMTVEERTAFTHTTGNTTAPLPTTMLNEIWDLVSNKHVIMGDIKTYKTQTVLEVVKHTTIVQGKAKTVNENAANDDEKNTMVKVTLSGKDFSKHVVISYAMATMSIDAFESYLVNEIANNIGEALADDTIATIKAGIASGNNVTSSGVKAITYKELATLFGKLKKVSTPVVYVNNSTFYNYLVSMEDTTGRPIFQPTMQAGAQGVLLGAQVKIEESVADNEILVGDPQKVVCNMVQDILIEQDKDVVNHTYIYSGYARAESALLNDTSFALLTVKQA